VTEAGTSGGARLLSASGSSRERCRGTVKAAGRGIVSDMCLQGEVAASAARFGSPRERELWLLLLGVVLKREEKGIWWMPWH
jgi:hypothetical protein